MPELSNKAAVVTGGNSGIGFAIARELIEHGARVLIVGRRTEAVDRAVEALGDRAHGHVGDVAELDTHAAIAARAKALFGQVDIYVANAGTISIASTAETGVKDYDAQFATNTRGVFFGVQRIAPVLANGASLILVSSIATAKVLEGHAVYAGAKAALEAFARAWAVEFAPRRIRVNVLSPGPTETPILDKLGVPSEARGEFEAQLAAMIPHGRLGRPDDLARAAAFLASDEAQFITGAVLPVDGGVTLT